MEREARYAAVGAFVLLVLAMAALFVYWYAEGHEKRNYTRYEVYFDGSVSGLARGAPVRYLGVDVGRVVRMSIDPRNSSRVEVVVDIDSSAPVAASTLAELSLQGVTGLLYIDLIVSPAGRKLAEAVPSIEYPVIRSTRSNFDVFLASLPGLVTTVGEVSARFARIFSDQNIAAIGGALTNIGEASAQLPNTLRDIRGLTADLRSASTEISSAALSVHSLTDRAGPELMTALEHVRAVADSLSATSAKFDALAQDNRQDVRIFAREGLPELEQLLREGRGAALELRELSRELRDNPSRLLYQTKAQGLEIPP
jgi:phospholipid/cholesterol/gamma-HCH transport system substrate-binding protein